MERRYEELQKILQEVKLKEEHKGYYYKVWDILLITTLGIFCGLRDLKQIHQWAKNPDNTEYMREYFNIHYIPCYSWFTQLLGLIDPKSLNERFMLWVQSILPDSIAGTTVSVDGKTVCSTEKMECYSSPLHIVSAHVSEYGITFGQEAVKGKSNEIPAVRDLLKSLKIKGCIVVADALNCQKETAEVVIQQGADYLFCVKDNHSSLKADIEDFVQDETLRKAMDTAQKSEVRSDRKESRTAYATTSIDWLDGKNDWKKLSCIGALHTRFTTKKGISGEWHYYISSRPLTAAQLLEHARAEWSVEAMHWLLDVNFGEDGCKVRDET